eukprot:746936-Hanusia_phi.AAC.1
MMGCYRRFFPHLLPQHQQQQSDDGPEEDSQLRKVSPYHPPCPFPVPVASPCLLFTDLFSPPPLSLPHSSPLLFFLRPLLLPFSSLLLPPSTTVSLPSCRSRALEFGPDSTEVGGVRGAGGDCPAAHRRAIVLRRLRVL